MGVFAEPFHSNGCFFGSLILALRLHVTIHIETVKRLDDDGELALHQVIHILTNLFRQRYTTEQPAHF
jgi:hypothetical protein